MFLLRERIFGGAAFVVTRSAQALNSIPNTKISPKTGETSEVAHNFNPSILRAEAELCEFEANLIHRAISSSQRSASRPCQKQNKTKTMEEKLQRICTCIRK